MLNMKRISLSVLLFLFTFTYLSAQNHGQIRGHVTDATGEDLIGVNVAIAGTSIGNATDIDGNYIIRRVPTGTHTLVFSYIGYERSEVEIEVKAGETIEVNMTLQQEAIQGEEIVIGAQRQGQQQAINQQITSDKIVNVVSESKIQEMPDFNAAAALGRLPGISTQKSAGEDNKVVIRGLSPKYNSIEVEGIKLSATGSSQMGLSSEPNVGSGSVNNDRSVDLTMVSPYMIRMISVYKSLTPDMNANSIGGTVNMELREAPTDLRWSAMWQQGYTAKSNTVGNYRAVASVSNRFIDDKLGIYVLGNLESYDRNADNMNAGYDVTGDESTIDPETGFRPVEVSRVTFNRHIETRNRYGANLIMDYGLPNGSLKFVNMYAQINSDYINHDQSINYNTGEMRWNMRDAENNTAQQMHSLKLDYDLDFMSVDLSASYTRATNLLEDSPSFSFNQTGALSGGTPRLNEQPEELTYLLPTFKDPENVILRSANLFTNDYEEEKFTYKADFQFPFNIGTKASGYFKVGGQMNNQTNTVDQETPYLAFNSGDESNIQGRMMESIANEFGVPLNSQGVMPAHYYLSDNEDLFDPFLGNDFGGIFYASNRTLLRDILDYVMSNPDYDASNSQASSGSQGGWYDGPYQQLTNDYEYKEDYYATYAMTRINVWDFMIIGGARYEKLDTEYFAYNARDQRNAQKQQMYDTTSYGSNEFLLPMGQIKYSPTSWLDVRYAYTQTLARPDYHQISPKFTVTQGNYVYTGNPELKPAKSFNHDVNVTFHANKLGLLSVGVFYKTIEDFAYTATYQLDAAQRAGIDNISNYRIIRDGNAVVTPQNNATIVKYMNNPFDAVVRGVELDFQHNFWYLPKALSNMVFGVNYARMFSEAEYPFYKTTPDYSTRPPTPVLVDSSFTGRLLDQPNHVLNSYLGYDYKGFSARVSVLFQANAFTSNGTAEFPEDDSWSRDYFRVDFSARQKLPFLNSEVFMDVSNLNDAQNRSEQRSINGLTNVQNYGLTANLGVRIRY